MTTTETSIEVLKSRVAKGLVYCSDLCNRRNAAQTDEEYKLLDAQLDTQVKRLQEFNIMLNHQGFSDCVLGGCKMDLETLTCFCCSVGH